MTHFTESSTTWRSATSKAATELREWLESSQEASYLGWNMTGSDGATRGAPNDMTVSPH
jgi:hypothetical protein